MAEKKEKEPEMVLITLKGAVAFESKVSLLTAINIVKLCATAGRSDQDSISSPSGTSSSPGDERVSLGEYVNKYEPTTYPEKILAIAAYLKEFKDKESFSPEDIRPFFRSIGDVSPKNFGRDFRVAISNTWIAPEDKDPNSYYVTSVGLKALKSNFAGEAVKKRKPRSKRKKNGTAVSKKNTEG